MSKPNYVLLGHMASIYNRARNANLHIGETAVVMVASRVCARNIYVIKNH